MSPDSWDGLKQGYRGLGLAAACCGGAVVPVTSRTGWFFFRHAPGEGCGGPETPDHLVAKTMAARAAEALGLEAATEARGPGGRWRADVLVRHPAAGWRVALEVQLARCALDGIEARQARYAADGVRGAWLVGFDPPRHEPSRDLPLFRIETRAGGRIDPRVLCEGADGHPRHASLPAFVTRLLTGCVGFVGAPPCATAVSAVGAPSTCWRCRRELLLLVGFANLPNEVLAPRGFLPARDLGKLPGLLAGYRAAIPTLLRAAPELTVLRPPRRPDAASDLQAFCPWDDAPQSLHKVPAELLDPGRHRCWTFRGEPWTPAGHGRPRWVVRAARRPGDHAGEERGGATC